MKTRALLPLAGLALLVLLGADAAPPVEAPAPAAPPAVEPATIAVPPHAASAMEEARALLQPAPLPLSARLGGQVTTGDPRSSVVMPEQRIGIAFNHRVHLTDAGLSCTDCHAGVKTSRSTSDLNLPARTVCMDCHDSKEVPGVWTTGPGVAGPEGGPGRRAARKAAAAAAPSADSSAISMPAAHLHFSHEKHLGMEGVTCATCHARVADEKVATREDLPSMETCLGCHDGVKAPNECRTCHLAGPGGTIRTSFASGTLVPDDHGVHWLKEHSAAAERDMGLCASCHAQSDCLSCHDGSVPPAFHESNYLMIHPSDAMANNPPCASCHRVDRFCRDCHLRSDVTLGGSMTTGEFHPMGWLTPGDPNHHSNVAKKNLEQCTACHAQEDCIACHAFYQGAPRTHPAGWRDSEQMRLLRSANFALCLRCHGMGEPGDPIP